LVGLVLQPYEKAALEKFFLGKIRLKLAEAKRRVAIGRRFHLRHPRGAAKSLPLLHSSEGAVTGSTGEGFAFRQTSAEVRLTIAIRRSMLSRETLKG